MTLARSDYIAFGKKRGYSRHRSACEITECFHENAANVRPQFLDFFFHPRVFIQFTFKKNGCLLDCSFMPVDVNKYEHFCFFGPSNKF